MRTFLLTLTAAFLGGGISVVVKVGVQDLHPVAFSFLRFIIAALAVLPLALPIVRFRHLMNRGLILAALSNTVNVVFFSFGVQFTSPVLSQILYLLSPIIVCVFEAAWLNERPSRLQVCGILLGTVGAVLGIFWRAKTGLSSEPLGIMLVLLAVFGYSAYLIFSRTVRSVFTPVEQTFTACIVTAASLLVPWGAIAATSPDGGVPHTLTGGFALLYCGVLGGAGYFLIVQKIIKVSSATAATAVLYVQPFTSAAWAAVLIGEEVSPILLSAAVLSIIGARLAGMRASMPSSSNEDSVRPEECDSRLSSKTPPPTPEV